MAPESNSDSGSHAGKNRKGFQIDGIRWEWPNPKGLGLQKLVPHEQIVGMLSAVENGVKNGHRAWEGLVQQGIRSTNLCRFQLPNVWREKKGPLALQAEDQGKEKREPAGDSVLSTRYNTNSASLFFCPSLYYMEYVTGLKDSLVHSVTSGCEKLCILCGWRARHVCLTLN